MNMSIYLILLAFLATIVGIFGGSWENGQTGFKKLTKAGWLALLIAILAAILSFSKDHYDSKARTEEERNLLFKRYDGLSHLATQTWYMHNMLKSISSTIADRPEELSKLVINQVEFLKEDINYTLQTYSSAFNREERNMADGLFISLNLLHNKLRIELPLITPEKDLLKLSDLALEANKLFCEPIHEKQPGICMDKNR